MTEHTVKAYEQELRELVKAICEMGELANAQIRDSVKALVDHNDLLAKRVIVDDDAIDVMQRKIEEKAVEIIAKRQPMANDLREIVGALRLTNDLERIGDHAKNIAKRADVLKTYTYPKHLMTRIDDMADLALDQMSAALDSYAQHDTAKALSVWNADEKIDAAHTSLFRELLTYMMEDAHNITVSIHLLFCAKNIERIGDHVTNIAEIVHYVVEGAQVGGERPKADASSFATASVL